MNWICFSYVEAHIRTNEIVVGIVTQLIYPYWIKSLLMHKISLLFLLTTCTTCPCWIHHQGLTVRVPFRLRKATDPSKVGCIVIVLPRTIVNMVDDENRDI